MSEKTLHSVLNPISYMGLRFERGETIAMTEADARNIGSDYVAPVTNETMSDDTTEPQAPVEGTPTPEGEYVPEKESGTDAAPENSTKSAPNTEPQAPVEGTEGEQVNG